VSLAADLTRIWLLIIPNLTHFEYWDSQRGMHVTNVHTFLQFENMPQSQNAHF
jgi:hypothetical protein